jgi:hypothetical protein
MAVTLSEQYPDEMLPVRALPLTQGLVALVDPDDPTEPWQYKWTATKNRYKWYAVRRVRRPDGAGYERVYLHRFVTGVAGRIDHENGNGLDNRRRNLREATNAQNMANQSRLRKDNKSGHTGVFYYKRTGRWIASAGARGYIGYFATFDEAVVAYHSAMEAKYGEFAPKCCPPSLSAGTSA